MSIFQDQALGLVLQFSNPNKGEMDKATKNVAKLSAEFDSLVRKQLTAKSSIQEITATIKDLDKAIQLLQKRGGIDQVASKAVRGILSRYTPDRVSAIGDYQAVRQRKLGSNDQLANALTQALPSGVSKRQESPAQVGRALVVSAAATRKQIYEFSAVIVEFSKITGEILNSAKEAYHAMAPLVDRSRKHVNEVRAAMRDDIHLRDASGISQHRIQHLLNKVDMVVGYRIGSIVQKLGESGVRVGAKPQGDLARLPLSTYGLPARGGFNALLRTTMDPRDYAQWKDLHTPSSAASNKNYAVRRLLSSTPQKSLEGTTFMGLLAGIQRGGSDEKAFVKLLKEDALEIQRQQLARLQESTRFPTALTARARRPQSGGPGGHKLAGVSQEATPGQLGRASLPIDRRLRVVNEFLTALDLVSPRLVTAQYLVKADQAERHNSRKKGVVPKSDLRSGEDIKIGIMQETVRSLRLLEEYSFRAGSGKPATEFKQQSGVEKYLKGDELRIMRATLADSKARPTKNYSDRDIEELLYSVKKTGGTKRIPEMAQALNSAMARAPGEPGIDRELEKNLIHAIRTAQNTNRDANFRNSFGRGRGGLSVTSTFSSNLSKAMKDAMSAAARSSMSGGLSMGGGAAFGAAIDSLVKSAAAKQVKEAVSASLEYVKRQFTQMFPKSATPETIKTSPATLKYQSALKKIEADLQRRQAALAEAALEASDRSVLTQIRTGKRVQAAEKKRKKPFSSFSPEEQHLFQAPVVAATAREIRATYESAIASTSNAMEIRAARRVAAISLTENRLGRSAKMLVGGVEKFTPEAKETIGNYYRSLPGSGAASQAAFARAQAQQQLINSMQRGGGRGGGGAGGTGQGGGGRGGHGAGMSFASRGGSDFGLGLAGAAAYLAIVREITKETIQYAARTETLELVTRQMAKVNGLNTTEVLAQVEAVKRLNITTQEANLTVQKMMFAQLDVAKSVDLARVAQDTAILSNKNSSEALDKIMLGIVTGQTRVLHNLNLQVSLLQVIKELRMEKRAKGDMTEPTELEKRQGMLNKVLMEGAKIFGVYERSMLTASKQYNSLTREAQEAANAVGREFLPEFGRTVSLMTRGLHYVQENSKAFAGLASAMVGLSAAAATAGTSSFIRWMMSSPAIPPWIKAGSALVGAGAMMYMNQDTETALNATADEQIESLRKKMAQIRKEREMVLKQGPGDTAESMNDYAFTLARMGKMLQSGAENEKAIQQQLTDQLAKEYDTRVKDYQDYIDKINGKQGLLGRVTAGLTAAPDKNLLERAGDVLTLNPFRRAEIFEEDAKRMRNVPIPSNKAMGVRERDVQRAKAALDVEREAISYLHQELQDTKALERRGMVAQFQQSEAQLMKIEEQGYETGRLSVKARKAMGTPRQKINIDYEMEVAQVSKLAGDIQRLRKEAVTDVTQRDQLNKLMADLGGGSVTRGEDKIKEFLDRQSAVIDDARQRRDDQLAKISAQNKAAFIQSRENLQLEQVSAGVRQGVYADEISAVNQSYQIKKKNLQDILRYTQDVDEYSRRTNEADIERQTKLLQIETRRKMAVLERLSARSRSEAEFRSDAALSNPYTTEEGALASSMQERVRAVQGDRSIGDDARAKELADLIYEFRRQIRDTRKATAAAEAASAVGAFEQYSSLATNVDRIASSQGPRSRRQRDLDEIQRTRMRAEEVANYRFNTLSPAADGPVAVSQLGRERDEALQQAIVGSLEATVKLASDTVDEKRQNLVDLYQQQYERTARINDLQATGAAEEQAAAYNTHQQRLVFIQKEFEARGKTVDAESARQKQLRDADFDYLQTLLAARKKEIEDVRSAAGSIYDATIARGGGGGVRELIKAQTNVFGRQVFQNVAAESLGTARNTLGRLIGGQETTDASGKRTPTLLGRMLGGTLLAPTHTEDINKLLASVTEDNTTAQQELTEAISALDSAIREAYSLTSAAGVAGGVSLGSVGSTIGKATGMPGLGSAINQVGGIFSGVSSSNPMIFHSNSSTKESRQKLLMDSMGLGSGAAGGSGKTSLVQSLLGSATMGATGRANIFDVLSGAPSVRTGAGSATAMTKSERAAAGLGAGLTVGMGALTAYQGFKQGGAKGVVGGIGGLLGMASAIPGPQQPFIAAGAVIAGFVGKMLGDKIDGRKKEIDRVNEATRFVEPVMIDREIGLDGQLLSYNKLGRARSSGLDAFPVNIQQNERRRSVTDTWWNGERNFVDLPGRVLNTPVYPSQSGPITIQVQIDALDSKSVVDRSPDIVRAIYKEMKGGRGGDLAVAMQNSIFGV
jgi:hypothetical protein